MITVYYGCYSAGLQTSMYCNEPEPVIKNIINGTGLDKDNIVFKCPAVQDYMYNLYQVTATWDYSFEWDGNTLLTNDYDQNTFNNTFTIRDIKNGLISYNEPNIYFFAECDTLKVSLEPVTLEKNGLDILTIPGVYDIAKHFRRLELPMVIKKPQVINITAGTPLYYLRFHTEEKVKFVRFNMTSELDKLATNLLMPRMHTKRVLPLEWYYNNVERFYKKRFLKIIKENILE